MPPTISTTSTPTPAYQAPSNSPIHVNRPIYDRIANTAREPTLNFTLPIRSGRAWIIPAGHICRISTPEGPQVGDLNIWSLHNPRERFWAARTRQLHRSHITKYDRLWSCLPYLRPLVTIIGDSLAGYGVDGVGGRVHDLLGTRCDPYVNTLLTSTSFDYHCHSNLTRAILPYGLAESDVHDVLNVFQVTGLNKDGQYFMQPCPAKPGDYFDFFAEIDVLCALSTCPGGDLSAWAWGEGGTDSAADRGASHAAESADNAEAKGGEKDNKLKTDTIDMLDCCRPLEVTVYKLIDSSVLQDWKPPISPDYTGMHGISLPTFQRPQDFAAVKENIQ